MNNSSVMDEIINTLTFEVEAIPQDKDVSMAPLKVKIKLKKNDKVKKLLQSVNAVPETGHSKYDNNKIQAISSEQTITSFEIVMTEDVAIKKPIRKQKRVLYLFKKAGCLGTSIEDVNDEYAYSKNTPKEANENKLESNISTSSNPYEKRNFTLVKNYESYQTPHLARGTRKDFLGKCKPGGCLDPPFGEDKYTYVPKIIEMKIPGEILAKMSKNEIESISSSTKKNNSIIKSENDYMLDNKGQPSSPTKISSINVKKSLSIITYPSISSTYLAKKDNYKINIKDKRNSKDYTVSSKSSEKYLETYYISPKKIKLNKDNEEDNSKLDQGNVVNFFEKTPLQADYNMYKIPRFEDENIHLESSTLRITETNVNIEKDDFISSNISSLDSHHVILEKNDNLLTNTTSVIHSTEPRIPSSKSISINPSSIYNKNSLTDMVNAGPENNDICDEINNKDKEHTKILDKSIFIQELKGQGHYNNTPMQEIGERTGTLPEKHLVVNSETVESKLSLENRKINDLSEGVDRNTGDQISTKDKENHITDNFNSSEPQISPTMKTGDSNDLENDEKVTQNLRIPCGYDVTLKNKDNELSKPFNETGIIGGKSITNTFTSRANNDTASIGPKNEISFVKEAAETLRKVEENVNKTDILKESKSMENAAQLINAIDTSKSKSDNISILTSSTKVTVNGNTNFSDIDSPSKKTGNNLSTSQFTNNKYEEFNEINEVEDAFVRKEIVDGQSVGDGLSQNTSINISNAIPIEQRLPVTGSIDQENMLLDSLIQNTSDEKFNASPVDERLPDTRNLEQEDKLLDLLIQNTNENISNAPVKERLPVIGNLDQENKLPGLLIQNTNENISYATPFEQHLPVTESLKQEDKLLDSLIQNTDENISYASPVEEHLPVTKSLDQENKLPSLLIQNTNENISNAPVEECLPVTGNLDQENKLPDLLIQNTNEIISNAPVEEHLPVTENLDQENELPDSRVQNTNDNISNASPVERLPVTRSLDQENKLADSLIQNTDDNTSYAIPFEQDLPVTESLKQENKILDSLIQNTDDNTSYASPVEERLPVTKSLDHENELPDSRIQYTNDNISYATPFEQHLPVTESLKQEDKLLDSLIQNTSESISSATPAEQRLPVTISLDQDDKVLDSLNENSIKINEKKDSMEINDFQKIDSQENLVKAEKNKVIGTDSDAEYLVSTNQESEIQRRALEKIDESTKITSKLKESSTEDTLTRRKLKPTDDPFKQQNSEIKGLSGATLKDLYDPSSKKVIPKADGSKVMNNQEEVIHVNMAFQSYITDENETFIRTLNTPASREDKLYIKENVVEVNTTLKPGDRPVAIPIDEKHNLSLQIKKAVKEVNENPLKKLTSKDYGSTSSKFGKDRTSSTTKRYLDNKNSRIKKIKYTENGKFGYGNLQHTLDKVYDKNLVPLHEIIRNLQNDVDELAKKKHLVQDSINQNFDDTTIPVRKKCDCVHFSF